MPITPFGGAGLVFTIVNIVSTIARALKRAALVVVGAPVPRPAGAPVPPALELLLLPGPQQPVGPSMSYAGRRPRAYVIPIGWRDSFAPVPANDEAGPQPRSREQSVAFSLPRAVAQFG